MTVQAEDEAVTDGARFFHSVEDIVLHYHPEWMYLVNVTLPVRPPTEAESAAYAARYEDKVWGEIYQPAEPRIVLPVTPEVAALLDPKPEPAPEPLPELPPLPLDEHTETALMRFNAAHDELPAEDELAPDPKHEARHDTQVLPEVSG